MTPRADVRHGLLTPETEDLAALTTSGDDPTVLAFALLSPARGGDLVAYEVLNLPEPATYVYRAGGPDPRPSSTRHSTTTASPRPTSTPRHRATWPPPTARTPRPPRSPAPWSRRSATTPAGTSS